VSGECHPDGETPRGHNRRLLVAALAAAAAAGLSAGCSRSSIAPTPDPDPGGAFVLVGAGDIADCGLQGASLTARLLDRIDGTVITLGDNAYPGGARVDFLNCYDPTWGRHIDRTRPSPGNHDYDTPGAAGYFEYFGERAGPPGEGYYRYTVGAWTVMALNSETGVRSNSVQAAWLRANLSVIPTRCTLAYWHRPLFSSGPNGNNADMRDIWRILYEFGVDLVLTGHDHLYERFAPQDPDGRPDQSRGIRQITAGTGGGPLTPFAAIRPNSEVRGVGWGVLKLTLAESSYSWEFIPVEGGSLRDSGTSQCH